MLVLEVLLIWCMVGVNWMLFDCFDVDSKVVWCSVVIFFSCLCIECWGCDVVLWVLNFNGCVLLVLLSEVCLVQVICLCDGDILYWCFFQEELYVDEW